MGSLGGRSRKHEKHRSKRPVRPTGFRDVMTLISMAGLSETVSRNEQPKAPTAVRFGKGNNIPHGMKFAVEGRARGHRDKRGPRKGLLDPSGSSDSKESSEEERPRRSGKKEPAREKRRSQEDPSSSDSSSTSSSSPESRSETSLSSSTTSDDSGSDSDRRCGHRKKRKSRGPAKRRRGKKKNRKRCRESKAEREERKTLAKQKVDPPGMYDGRPDLAVFDKWTYEVNTWIKMTKYREPTVLNLLVKYITSTAGEFFMSFIAGCKDTWSIQEMFEALFDYCFPPDFKDRLRVQLSSASQGKRRIRDFVRDIEKLVSRFPDVNE